MTVVPQIQSLEEVSSSRRSFAFPLVMSSGSCTLQAAPKQGLLQGGDINEGLELHQLNSKLEASLQHSGSVLASKPDVQGLAEVSKFIPITSFTISNTGLLWTHVEDAARMPRARGCTRPAGSTAGLAASHTSVIPSEEMS